MNRNTPGNPTENEGATRQNAEVGAQGSTTFCATCHRLLVPQGDQGACVYCLVNFVSLPEEDELLEEEPGVGNHSPATPRRYGHFEILTHPDGSSVELGHGAMGTTYRARDMVLHRAVALKVIERGIAEHPAARARFLREARAAAQFQHPNVAAVSQYGEQAGECFYAMELVEGETLEARVLREGSLPVALALDLTIQVTRALVAAEARGIIHRDLKPTNLMLAAAEAHGDAADVPVVKVIDFGLAKALNAATATEGVYETRGAFVGTPAFASPEQFDRSGDNHVDHRSDIYSLGATLWYALVGQSPFLGRSLEEIRIRQSEPLPLRTLTAREIPRPVVALLASMLSADPAARPQSARELLDELCRCREACQPARPPARRRAPARWTIAAACVLLGLIVAGGMWWNRHRPNLSPDERSVAVLPFENLSPKPDDAFFTTGVQDEITASLARAAGVRVINPSSTKGYPPGKRDLAAIGRALGVTHLLEGSARREDDRMNISLRLVDLHAPGQPWTKKYQRRLADVFAVQGEIARALLDELQVALTPAEQSAINRPPTLDLAAYDLFLRAIEGPEVFPDMKSLCRHKEDMIVLLDQAIARDPGFTRAYCALAASHDYLWSHWQKKLLGEPPVDHRALAESALQKARRLEPDSGDVHLALANHLQDIHDNEQASIEADLACQLLPNSARAQYMAGVIATQSCQLDKATRCLERSVALNPLSTLSRWMLASVYGYQRRTEDSAREFSKLIPLAPADEKLELAFDCTMGPLESRADLAPLRAYVAGLSAANDPDGSARFKAGLILKLFEHDADGTSLLLVASGENEFAEGAFVYPKEWFQAQVALMRHDQPGARTAFTAARLAMEKRVAAHPDSGWDLSYLAVIDAGLGRKEEAIREAVRACELWPYEKQGAYAPVVQCNLAIVYAWTGQPDLAFAELDKAVSRPAGDCFVLQPTYGDLRLNPLWDAMRSDPRFDVLVQKLAPRKAP